MIATRKPVMRARLFEFFRHPRRGVAALVLLAVAPKCVVCVAAYVGVGAVLGLGGPEWCGGTGDSFFTSAGTSALAWCGVAGGLGAAGWWVVGRRARLRSSRCSRGR